MTLDRTTVLAGLPSELSAFGQLLGSLHADDLTTPSRYAGRTVADIAGHVIGTAVDLAHGRLEGQGTPEVTRRQARERAGRTPKELADELAVAGPALCALLASVPDDAWVGSAPGNPEHTLGFGIEAIWYDAYLHGDDIRDALGLSSERGDGLRCAVHHVAGSLEHQKWGPATIALEGIERIEIGGGGPEITGDPLEFVLAATGRRDPSVLGFDPTIKVDAADDY
jgi:uncharacterized protein (TIGR03083 family)